MMKIETPRLILRQWQDSDLEPFAALNADPEVMRYFQNPLKRAESDAGVARLKAMIARDGFGFFAAQRRDTKQTIGFIGISRVNDGLPFAPCVEIGWRLAREHWNLGFATEGAQAALEAGFTQHHLDEIFSFTPTQNAPSERVMLKLGMTKQSNNFTHPKLPPEHDLAEHVLYKITKHEWQSRSREPS